MIIMLMIMIIIIDVIIYYLLLWWGWRLWRWWWCCFSAGGLHWGQRAADFLADPVWIDGFFSKNSRWFGAGWTKNRPAAQVNSPKVSSIFPSIMKQHQATMIYSDLQWSILPFNSASSRQAEPASPMRPERPQISSNLGGHPAHRPIIICLTVIYWMVKYYYIIKYNQYRTASIHQSFDTTLHI